jgi:hypothetical protein
MGQIVIPADAGEAVQIKEGDKVVILRGPLKAVKAACSCSAWTPSTCSAASRDRPGRTQRDGG